MSYQYVPSLFRIPPVPNLTPPDGFWRGLGDDNGFYAFKIDYTWGNYLITRGSFAYSILVDGSEYKPVYSPINGYIYWSGSSGFVYKSIAYDGWVLSRLFPGQTHQIYGHKRSVRK